MVSHLVRASIIDTLNKEFGEFPVTMLITAITVAVALLLSHLIREVAKTHLKGSGALSLLVNLVRALIVVAAVFFLGEGVFHVQMSGLIQALGITTLVVSLGLQDLIKSVVAACSWWAGTSSRSATRS